MTYHSDTTKASLRSQQKEQTRKWDYGEMTTFVFYESCDGDSEVSKYKEVQWASEKMGLQDTAKPAMKFKRRVWL